MTTAALPPLRGQPSVRPRDGRFGPLVYLASLGALGALPIFPEFWLWLRHYDDIKAFAPVAYYECIVSLFLLAPALLLPVRASRAWVVVVAIVTGIATLVVGYQAITTGGRWDATAHAAIWETNSFESWGFVRAFVTVPTVAWLVAGTSAFVAAAFANLQSRAPTRRTAVLILAVGLAVGGYGIRNFLVYGREVARPVTVEDGATLRLIEIGPNACHPVLRLAYAQWNYAETHAYQLQVLRGMHRHLTEMQGAVPVPGATEPRILLFVIGESSSRRHWSLYGYGRETNPELGRLGDQLLVFRDVVCRTVGTLTEIHGMLCAPRSSVPVLALFAAAGYRTHWFSAQLDQGPNDVKLAALVQTCDERVFLNGAYDERLLPLVRRAIAEPGRHLIVVNLFGSHVRYEDRFPARFAVFQGDGDKGRRLAAYDNSIRYTDHVLAGMIGLLAARPDPSCFIYVSDHAEDVYDSDPDRYLFRADDVATDAMYEIPLTLWFSPAYRRANADVVRNASQAVARPIQSLGLYHTLIDLARLRHPVFDPHASIVSPEFTAHDRHVGAAGRIYSPRAAIEPAPAR